MNNLRFEHNQTSLDVDPDHNGARFNLLYKNNHCLLKKQQQRRNEILSNRQSKRDKLMAGIRRLVADVASESDENDDEDRTNLNRASEIRTPTVIAGLAINSMIPDSQSKQQNHSNNGSLQQSNILDNTRLPTDNDISNKQEDDSGDSTCGLGNQSTNSDPSRTKCKNDDRKFRNKAMLSEWLVDRPMDFESEWVLKATPVGRRCLVFARKGETVAYSRTGQYIRTFQSALPGGCRSHTAHSRRQFAIVDCIYVHNTSTFYMMDALAWNEHKLYESEASFRFFWLQSRYNENQEKLLTLNARNECRFYCLQTYTASDHDILTALHEDPIISNHKLQLDGLLFFHIRGPYVPGANPLVLWIKPDMVNRVLNLPIN